MTTVNPTQPLQALLPAQRPAATYQVRGVTLPMGQALAQLFGNTDPALAKLDAEKGRETQSMPQKLRDRLSQLKNERSKP